MCVEKGTLSALKGSFVNFRVKWENEKEWWSKSAWFFQVNEFRKNQVAIIEVFNETKFLPENHLNRENWLEQNLGQPHFYKF